MTGVQTCALPICNDAELFRDLRIILIAAQKNYVLNAPLGDIPIAGADADIMNV